MVREGKWPPRGVELERRDAVRLWGPRGTPEARDDAMTDDKTPIPGSPEGFCHRHHCHQVRERGLVIGLDKSRPVGEAAAAASAWNLSRRRGVPRASNKAPDREAPIPLVDPCDASVAVYEGRFPLTLASRNQNRGLTAIRDLRGSRSAGEPGSRNPARMSSQPRGFQGEKGPPTTEEGPLRPDCRGESGPRERKGAETWHEA